MTVLKCSDSIGEENESAPPLSAPLLMDLGGLMEK